MHTLTKNEDPFSIAKDRINSLLNQFIEEPIDVRIKIESHHNLKRVTAKIVGNADYKMVANDAAESFDEALDLITEKFERQFRRKKRKRPKYLKQYSKLRLAGNDESSTFES